MVSVHEHIETATGLPSKYLDEEVQPHTRTLPFFLDFFRVKHNSVSCSDYLLGEGYLMELT